MTTEAAELTISIGAKETVTAVLARLEAQLERGDATAQRLAAALESKLARGQGTAKESALAHAQAQARLLTVSGNLAEAEVTLRRALDGVDRESTAAIRAETQLAQIRAKLVNQTRQTATANKSVASSLLELAGPLGIATTGVGAFLAVAGKVKEGFDLRATLDEQRRSIGTLLGSVQKGDQVFQQAAEFGRRYGFTQKEMGESAAAAAPLIKTSTTAVEKQLEVLGRLASLNAREGFQGATFSTKELASGDITSIVERFNIARSAANQMKQEIAKGADVFEVLDRQLNKMGVTVDVLANRTQGAAGAMRAYEQAQEDLSLAMGKFAEGPGVKVLDFLTKFTNTVTQIGTSGDLFAPITDQLDAQNAKLLEAGGSYEQYTQRVQAAQTQLTAAFADDPVTASLLHLQQLTPAQYEYAQSLIATGQSQQQAFAAAQALADVSDMLAFVQQKAALASEEQGNTLAALGGQLLTVASYSEENRSKVVELASAYAAGEISADDLRSALAALEGAHNAAVQAAAQEERENRNLARSFADIVPAANAAAAAIANVAGAQSALAGRSIQDKPQNVSRGLGGGAGATADNDLALIHFRAQLDAQRKAYEDSLRKTRGGVGGVKLSDQQKLNNSLLADQEKANDQFEDAEFEHARNLLKIQLDYQQKSLEQQRANEVAKRQSLADFYDALTSSELNKSKEGKAALAKVDSDYQAAYQKSQELAQQGNAKLAADYLALKQRQAQQELQYQEALAKAKQAKDAAEVQRLEAIHKLRQDAAAEEEKQLLAGGDANAKARDEALANEDQRYAEAQGKIGDSADRAAERKILAAERAGKAIDAEQAKLNTLAQTYDKIAPAATGGQSAPAGTAAAGVPVGSAPGDALSQALEAVRGAVAAVEAAVRESGQSVTDATKAAGDKVAGAVRSIPRGSGGIG